MSDINTEKKILEAAIDVFLDKGYDGARTQMIADKAGMNKALIHYYFGNKQKLFVAAFKSLMGQFLQEVTTSMESMDNVPDIITTLADQQLALFRKKRNLPLFILVTLHHHPHLIKEVIQSIQISTFADILCHKISTYKNISLPEAKIWLVTFISTRLMPFAGAELFKTILAVDDSSYDRMLDQQKEFSLDLFLNNDPH